MRRRALTRFMMQHDKARKDNAGDLPQDDDRAALGDSISWS
jgi:hypothetical protein